MESDSRRKPQSNLLLSGTMIEPRRGSSQTAGLSSSPDGDGSLTNFVDEEPIINTATAAESDSPSYSSAEISKQLSRAFSAEQRPYEGELKEAGTGLPPGDSQMGESKYTLGAVVTLNQPMDEETTFERTGSNGRNELIHSYHGNADITSNLDGDREEDQTESDENDISFSMDESGLRSVPAVWAAEDDYQEREGAPSAEEEESEEPVGLEYDNVEHKGCMGRLILTDDDLRFYQLEEVILTLSWDQVAKRQVSPPTYGVPMLRVKSIDNENFMFRLANHDMANTMREDLKMFEVAGSDHNTSPRPQNKEREHESFLVAGSVPEERMHEEGENRFNEGLEKEESTTDHDEDDEENEEKAASAPLVEKRQKSRRSKSFADEEKGRRPHRRASIQDLKAEAQKELDAIMKERQRKEERDGELKKWILYTCCCSAIVFLAVGGVSGYFIGRETTNKAIETDGGTPVPTEADSAPAMVPISVLPTAQPVESPTTAEAPSGQPPQIPTDSSDPDTKSPTLSPQTSVVNMTMTAEPTLGETLIPETYTTSSTVMPTEAVSLDMTQQPSMQPPSLIEVTVEPTTGEADTEVPTIDFIVVPTTAPSAGFNSSASEATFEPTSEATAGQTEAPTRLPTYVEEVESPQPSAPDTSEPTLMPSVSERETELPTRDNLRSILRQASPDQGVALDTEGTPQQLAYTWMVTDDQVQAGLSESKQIQRYSLATFYHSTGGVTTWERRRQAQEVWLDPSADDCDWDFIVCNDALEIQTLELLPPNGPVLAGTLPPEISLWSSLRDFVITTGNEEEAKLAREAKEEAMKDSDIKQRQDADEANSKMLTGYLPSEIGKLSLLENLVITSQALTGILPAEISNMSSIVIFDLSNNQLFSTVPWELGHLSNMQQLNLGFNSLQGNLEERMFDRRNGMAQSLSLLALNNNQLWGGIPTTFGLLTNMESGLFLESNRLTGTLPTELARLSKIKIFRVDSNPLTGTIPSDYRKWYSVDEFRVHDTALTGDVPGDLCRLFLVQETQTYANCELLACRCCTYCCSSQECAEA